MVDSDCQKTNMAVKLRCREPLKTSFQRVSRDKMLSLDTWNFPTTLSSGFYANLAILKAEKGLGTRLSMVN